MPLFTNVSTKVYLMLELLLMENPHKILIWEPEGKRPLERPTCGWKDNIKVDNKEVGCDDLDWIHLAQDRV
jgi:hypothetical protein